ncbi:GNAT family N-acetyltransferase [Streptomyces sp. NPDC005574]|uniref:GNAT family N-acetyltransferase n=1 Tax=Streptomyces sp. NPDC005574 TaxID=3156891 RepID=UPI0033B178B2
MIDDRLKQLTKRIDLQKLGRFSIRPYTPSDLHAMRELIAQDLLPGEAPLLSGLPVQSPEVSQIFILMDLASGRVNGVMCLSIRRFDGAGLIHWLYTGEDFYATVALLSFTLGHFGRRTLHAFVGPVTKASPRGLPVSLRPLTVCALTAAGFTPAASQHYMLRDLVESPVEPDDPVADVTLLDDGKGWHLVASAPDGRVLATALVSSPDARSGTANLWHLEVHPAHRREGIGSRLLIESLYVAAAGGARRVAVTIDPDAGTSINLLAAHGFDLIDVLVVYDRPACPC